MFRSFLPSALALTSVASAVTPQTVKAEWTVPQTQFLGFTDTGDLVTRGRNAAALNVLDATTGKSKRTVVFPEVTDWREVSDLTFTPDLNSVAWSNSRGDSVTVRTPDGQWTTPPANGVQLVKRLAFSPDGGTLAIVTQNNYIQLWDTKTRTRRHTMMLMTDPLVFSPNGKMLAAMVVYGRSRAALWDVATGEKRLDLPQVGTIPRPLQFLPDGTLLAGASRIGLNLDKLNQGDYGVSIASFPHYIEECSKGSPWKSCRRDVQIGSTSKDGNLVLLNIWRTPQNIGSALLYDKNDTLLKILDTPAGSNFPILTPDGQRLIWPSNQGDLLGARVP